MDAERPIRILLVDDHAAVREGLVAIIGRQADMKVVVEASNGIEGVDAYREHRPDVTLMDARMPGMDGITATSAILREFPTARILILSSTGDDFPTARRSGARACLLKEVPRQELFNTIRMVHKACAG